MSATAPMTLVTPIEAVPGVGRRRGGAFRRIGIPSVAHLVHHIPYRYEFEEAENPIDSLAAGSIVTARGEIASTRLAGRARRQRFEAILEDHTGRLFLVWFNQPFLHKKIHPGDRLRVTGQARVFENYLQIANPRWEKIDDEEPSTGESRLRPVYRASENLPSGLIEGSVQRVLDDALPLIEDHLSEDFRTRRGLPTLRDAYRMAHAPASKEEAGRARRRLAYDELLLLQVGLQMRRSAVIESVKAPRLGWSDEIDKRIRARIPFQLTPGQEEAIECLRDDLLREIPANRLLQGDVGSGKTVVALYAMLMAAASAQQAALMAPTELLAEQHYRVLCKLLDGSAVRIELLTGSRPVTERREIESAIASGEATIVVGTHALLTDNIRFQSLGLAIIDEQHRFGVHQRATLRQKPDDPATSPHVIVMTATPIPRTLALSFFGDLEVVTIRGLPPGRQPVQTRVLPVQDRTAAYESLRECVDTGGQGYVVAPVIDTGESIGLQDVETTLHRLVDGPLAGKSVAAVHGRLSRDERNEIMVRFRAGEIDVLVATTVIEVGVDVPNASIMIIEHAERFGLAQLHQLRGRVGRGGQQAECILVADPTTPDATARLHAMCEIADGFALSERDLEIRGPGEVLGVRQSGSLPFRVADLTRDIGLLDLARSDAREILKESPTLDRPQDKLLKSRLLKSHAEALGSSDVS